MSSINSFAVSGNVTNEPALKATKSGSFVLSFGVAVNERAKVNGEWTDVTSFFDCVIFGNRAESVSKYLAKGMKVFLSGRLKQDRWETNEGDKRSKVSLVVNEIEWLNHSRAEPKPSSEPANVQDYADDDLPF